MSIQSVSQIITLVAGIATILAILIAGIICLVRLVEKARKADSDGGVKITAKEWKEIIFALLPFGVKILEAVSNMEKQKENPEVEVKPEVKPEVKQELEPQEKGE